MLMSHEDAEQRAWFLCLVLLYDFSGHEIATIIMRLFVLFAHANK